MKVIQLTDLHLTKNKEIEVFNINPYDNFDFICREIKNKKITGVDLIVVSGDISDDGNINAYKYFLRGMESLHIPYIVILGNHDLKNTFDEAVMENKPEFIIKSSECTHKDWYITSVDTVVSGEDYGFITENNLKELERKLIMNNAFNTAIFMHHHTLPVGTPIVDSCMLKNASDLLNICDKYKVRFIGTGHAHTPYICHYNDITTCVTPAASFQWSLGTDTINISKGFGFNVICFSPTLSITSCIY